MPVRDHIPVLIPINQLHDGRRLYSNLNGPGKNHLLSTNGKYSLVMQSDGNLCVDRLNLDGKGKNKNLWGAKVRNKAQEGPFSLSLQQDGNLCVYNQEEGLIWSSKTDGLAK